MGWTFEQEVGRKITHVFALLYLVIYLVANHFFGHKMGLFLLSIILVILIYFEYMRIELKQKVPLVHHLWILKRRKEKNRLGAEVFWCLGIIISIAVFDLGIAIIAVLMSLFGDLAAALFGKRFGKTKMDGFQNKALRKKCWEGVIAEFLADIVIGYYFIRAINDPTIPWLYTLFPHGVSFIPVVIVMAIVATVTETAVSKLEDNLLVPIFAGFVGQLTLMILRAI